MAADKSGGAGDETIDWFAHTQMKWLLIFSSNPSRLFREHFNIQYSPSFPDARRNFLIPWKNLPFEMVSSKQKANDFLPWKDLCCKFCLFDHFTLNCYVSYALSTAEWICSSICFKMSSSEHLIFQLG
jgi:hypothetical protein